MHVRQFPSFFFPEGKFISAEEGPSPGPFGATPAVGEEASPLYLPWSTSISTSGADPRSPCSFCVSPTSGSLISGPDPLMSKFLPAFISIWPSGPSKSLDGSFKSGLPVDNLTSCAFRSAVISGVFRPMPTFDFPLMYGSSLSPLDAHEKHLALFLLDDGRSRPYEGLPRSTSVNVSGPETCVFSVPSGLFRCGLPMFTSSSASPSGARPWTPSTSSVGTPASNSGDISTLHDSSMIPSGISTDLPVK